MAVVDRVLTADTSAAVPQTNISSAMYRSERVRSPSTTAIPRSAAMVGDGRLGDALERPGRQRRGDQPAVAGDEDVLAGALRHEALRG